MRSDEEVVEGVRVTLAKLHQCLGAPPKIFGELLADISGQGTDRRDVAFMSPMEREILSHSYMARLGLDAPSFSVLLAIVQTLFRDRPENS